MATDDRRAVVEHLHSLDVNQVSLEDLVGFLAARDDHRVDPDRLALTLHHASLPKLAASGVLDYDTEARTVTYHGHPLLHEWLDDDANQLLEVVLKR